MTERAGTFYSKSPAVVTSLYAPGVVEKKFTTWRVNKYADLIYAPPGSGASGPVVPTTGQLWPRGNRGS